MANKPEMEFFNAVNANREELARAILKANPSVDINSHGAIHWAAVFQRDKMVDLLLSFGAELNTFKLHDSTPLLLVMGHFSPKEKKLLYMKKLLDAGAKVDLGKKTGESPLFSCHDAETAKLLIGYGADINLVAPSTGWSVLMTFCERGSFDLVSLLLKDERLTTMNHCDKYGYTALILSVEKGHLKLVELLVLHGADYTLPTPSGRSIFEIASPEIDAVLRNAVKQLKRAAEKEIGKSTIVVTPAMIAVASDAHEEPPAVITNIPVAPETNQRRSDRSNEPPRKSGLFGFFASSKRPSNASTTSPSIARNNEEMTASTVRGVNEEGPVKSENRSNSLTFASAEIPTANAIMVSQPNVQGEPLGPTVEEWRVLVRRVELLEKKVTQQQRQISAQEEEITSLKQKFNR